MEKHVHGRLTLSIIAILLPLCVAAQTAQAPPTAASAASPPPIVAQLPAGTATVATPTPPPADDPVATAIYGRVNFEFAAEMLNAFNHPNFLPVGGVGSSTIAGYQLTGLQGTNQARVTQFVFREDSYLKGWPRK